MGKPFNSTDVIPGINIKPIRRIKFLGLNNNYLILAYEQGGRALSHHIILFKYEKKTIIRFWSGYDYINDDITKDNIMLHIHESIKNE